MQGIRRGRTDFLAIIDLPPEERRTSARHLSFLEDFFPNEQNVGARGGQPSEAGRSPS